MIFNFTNKITRRTSSSAVATSFTRLFTFHFCGKNYLYLEGDFIKILRNHLKIHQTRHIRGAASILGDVFSKMLKSWITVPWNAKIFKKSSSKMVRVVSDDIFIHREDCGLGVWALRIAKTQKVNGNWRRLVIKGTSKSRPIRQAALHIFEEKKSFKIFATVHILGRIRSQSLFKGMLARQCSRWQNILPWC